MSLSCLLVSSYANLPLTTQAKPEERRALPVSLSLSFRAAIARAEQQRTLLRLRSARVTRTGGGWRQFVLLPPFVAQELPDSYNSDA